MSLNVYRVAESPTLHGKPAGPDAGEYLDFEAGDIVVRLPRDLDPWYAEDGVVQATRLSDGLPQLLDEDSLELVGSGLKLADGFEL